MPFNVALSGLRASSTDLEVTGNNIANASTVGYKKSRTEFGDLYSNGFLSGSGSEIGDGVLVQNIRQQFSQGNVSFTDNSLDTAITGNGFFVLSDDGEAKYSRAGQFGVDKDGFMVNNTGMRVQGFQADENGTISGVIGDLVVDADNLSPKKTTDVDIDLNLDSSQLVLEERGETIVSDGTNIGVPAAGTVNGYATQTIDVTIADGTTQQVIIPANQSAGATAAQFTAIDGIDATASTSVTIPVASYNNASQTMTITLNGLNFSATDPTATAADQLVDIGTQINQSALVGVTAVIDGGDMQIIQSQGADLLFSFAGGAADSFNIVGSDAGATALTLNTGTPQGSVGGSVNFILDQGVSFANAGGTTPVIATFTGSPFVSNAFDPTDAGTYNHATSTTIYDSLGNSHVLTMYFVKQDPSSTGGNTNTWLLSVQVDGRDVGDPLIGADATPASYSIVFEEDGTLNEALSEDILISNWVPLDANGNPNGAEGPLNVTAGGSLPIVEPNDNSNFEIDISDITQFGSPFGVEDLEQNGFTTGRIVGIDVGGTGVILSRYSNGESLVLGQIALANFNDVEGLSPAGDTVWVQTFESGEPIIGGPGTASLGSLTASAIEESNVDLSEQLVNLIVAQRNFQSNAKTIETADTITQAILNI